jgi:C4-type Zn-finger protein
VAQVGQRAVQVALADRAGRSAVDRKAANVAVSVEDRGYKPRTERAVVCATCNYRTTAIPYRTLRGNVYCSATCFQLAGR